MRNRWMLCGGVVFALSSCATDSNSPPPSCQQAMDHYYSVGCYYIELATQRHVPESEIIGVCQQTTVDIPSNCQSKLNAWLTCNDDVPGPGPALANCDCSQTMMAMLACK